MNKSKKTTKSSGNVFGDLGFDPAEAAVLQLRANLMSDLRLYIEKQKLTQAQVAKRVWQRTIPLVRPRARKMGQVQP
jgi:predicted XRE-type DNA-binding protein